VSKQRKQLQFQNTRSPNAGRIDRPVRVLKGSWQMHNKELQFLGLAAFATLFLTLNWNVLSQPPYFDEMWKIDFIASSRTIERYFTHNTPIPIGWLYLAKPLVWLAGDNFALMRIATAIWLPLGSILLIYALQDKTPEAPSDLQIGASLLGLFTPIQLTIRSFSQYGFEIFCSLLLIVLTLRAVSLSRHRLPAGGLTFVVMLPALSLSTVFLLPGFFITLFVMAQNKISRIVVAAVAVATTVSALIVYFMFYRPVLSSNPNNDLSLFWADYIVQGDPFRLLARLLDMPMELAQSLTPTLLLPTGSEYLIVCATGFGLLRIWYEQRIWRCC
jgi:hypothetical protein